MATRVKITKTEKHGTGKGWHDRVIQVANTKFVWAKIRAMKTDRLNGGGTIG